MVADAVLHVGPLSFGCLLLTCPLAASPCLQRDEFIIETIDLGKILRLQIGHDDS